MALDPRQTVCVKCGDVEFTDVTGDYEATDNPGGYGDPNPNFGDYTPYTAAFTPPKATASVYTLDLYEDPPAPDADGHYLYTITHETLGYEEVLISGIWTVQITLATTVKNVQFLVFDDIAAKVNACVCSGGVDNLYLNDLLRAAKELACCNKAVESQKLIDELYRLTRECCQCVH